MPPASVSFLAISSASALAIPSRMLNTKKPIERINFSKIKKVIDIPDLIEVQKQSYAEFLQQDVPEDKRKFQGLEEVFREIFPITDFNDTSVLEYVSYTIEKAKYTPRESIDRNTNYAAPLKVKVRLFFRNTFTSS